MPHRQQGDENGTKVRSLIRKAIRAWETVQVELHGQYSVARLHALREYMDSTSALQVLLPILLTPLPCLCVVVSLDALPLVDPAEGIAKQTLGFWIRGYYTCWSMVYLIGTQASEIVPALESPAPRLFILSLVVAAGMVGVVYGQMKAIGFPVPFTFYMQILPWMALAGSSLGFMWRPKIKHDPAAKKSFLRHLKATRIHIIATIVYIVYNVVYEQLSGNAQTFFLMLLPLIKLLFKTRISKALDHVEDLTPVIVVFHIDVFHGLFVSLALQQTRVDTFVIGLTIAIDVVQLLIGVYEVRSVLKHLHELSKTLETSNSKDFASLSPSLEHGIVAHALRNLQANERVRTNSVIAQPRDLRKEHQAWSAESSPTRRKSMCRCFQRDRSIHPASPTKLMLPTEADASFTAPLTGLERAQIEYSQRTLKLLYLTEFYVLIEYAEVMIATIYAAYVFALSHLPNRVYYSQFAAMSDAQMRQAASHVAVYALLELLTFLFFCGLLDYQIKGFSVMRQLAFTLRKHWKLIQSTVIVWVFVAIQIKFEHYGNDFTFKFKWLHREKESSTAG